MLREFEGLFLRPYLCPAGYCTIGYGSNLEAHPRFIPFEDIRGRVQRGGLRGASLLRVLRDLAEHKTTMIIVTHEMKFARDVADRILFMDGGVVVEQGDAKQVIDHPQEERTRKFLASYGK